MARDSENERPFFIHNLHPDRDVVKNDHSFYDPSMPRVTPEHSAARRQQILDAAHACFLRDGFHQTSMADIQRESGLSAGAIYIYFKGKDEIILGIAFQILETVESLIPDQPTIDGTPVGFADVVAVFLQRTERLEQERHVFPIALQIWAEAIRNPRMREQLIASLDVLRSRLELLVERFREHGIIPAGVPASAITLAMVGIGQGFIVQRTLLGPEIVDTYAAGIQTLLACPQGPVDRDSGTG
jgi:AcrR family transcriptional regulator